MYYIFRNNQQFGSYSIDVLKTYVEEGKILKQDKASSASNPQMFQTVGFFLKSNSQNVKVKHKGTFLQQLKDISKELIRGC